MEQRRSKHTHQQAPVRAGPTASCDTPAPADYDSPIRLVNPGQRWPRCSFVGCFVVGVDRGRCLALRRGPAGVLLQQAVQDLDACCRADRPPAHLPVRVETVFQRHIAPAVGVHNGLVELDVDLPHARHVGVSGVGDIRVVDQVVQLGKPVAT